MFNCCFQKRLKDIAIIVPGAFLTFAGYSIYEGNEKFYREYVMPFTHKFFDAETAHRLGVLAAKYNIVPRKQKTPDSPILVSVLVVKTTIYWSTGHSGHRYKTKSCWLECNQALFWSFDMQRVLYVDYRGSSQSCCLLSLCHPFTSTIYEGIKTQ